MSILGTQVIPTVAMYLVIWQEILLTGGDLRGEYKNSISLDQVAAEKLSRYTRFPSLTSCPQTVVWATNQEHLPFLI